MPWKADTRTTPFLVILHFGPYLTYTRVDGGISEHESTRRSPNHYPRMDLLTAAVHIPIGYPAATYWHSADGPRK